MAFKLYSTSDGRVPPIEYLPVTAITPSAGAAMVLSSGKLALATGTTKPTYICARQDSAARTAGDLIPVFRIESDMIFETNFSVAATAVKVGDKVTLHATDGAQVTATTTNGVAEVVSMDGTTAGSVCRVRF